MQTESIVYGGAFASLGIDNSSLDSFFDDFKVVINRLTEDDIEFDMIGINPALANAFRRILIAEVILPVDVFDDSIWVFLIVDL